MRRALVWIGRILLILVLVAVAAIAAVLTALNTGAGQRFAARMVGNLTGGLVTLSGLSGRFPDAPRVGRIEIRDTQGVWLTIDDAALDWSPLRLLDRDAQIQRLAASRVLVARRPVASATPGASNGSSFSLPVRVDLQSLHVDHIDLAAPVAGAPASLTLDGHAHLASLTEGDASIVASWLDGGGRFNLDGRIDAATLQAKLDAQEPAHGLVSAIANLPDLGPLSMQASVEGPWSAAATKLALSAGQLTASAHGTLNITRQAADLDVAAHAPAMRPRPDVSWESVALDAHVHGPFAKPDANGTLRIDSLAAAGASVRRLAADVSGNAGQVALKAQAEGIRVPGPRPDVLEAAPLTLQADARLDTPDRPVRFDLSHELIEAKGTAQTGGDIKVDATLTLPDLAPLAAIGNVDLQGHTALDIKAAKRGEVTQATVDGKLAVTGGMGQVVGLIGPDATLGVSAALHGSDFTLSRLQVDGKTLTVAANGGMTGGSLGLDWKLALADLKVLAPTVQGTLDANGHVEGKTDDLTADADLSGDLATQGFPRAPVSAHIHAQGLPKAPSAQITAGGTLDGSPLTIAVAGEQASDGALRVNIDKADWKSAHISGALTLPHGATLPQGKLQLNLARLEDLRPLIGQPVGGSIAGTADLGDKSADVRLEARNAGLAGTAEIGQAILIAHVDDPASVPVTRARLTADGIRASGMTGTVRLDADGPQDALALKLAAGLRNLAGADLQASSAATVNATAKQVALSALQATWKGETLKLLAPARVSFADGVAVDRARLGLGSAVLDLAGRASPTLDLTASLRNVTGDLARIVAPDLRAQGSLQADVRLTGTTARPTGTIHVAASGLHLNNGPAASLPVANINADIALAGTSARVDTRLVAGRNHVAVTGTAPIDPAGPLDLRAAGAVDLAVTDPILTAQGRQARGQLTLDAGVTGTVHAPRINGTARLANAEVQDFTLGARISDIQALIQAEGDTIRIERFNGKAGSGTVAINGTLGVAPPMPIDVRLTANNAKPLASDKLTAVMNADLSLRDQLKSQMDAGGSINIKSADIRIPDSLPVTVVTLNVIHPGQPPPPPPAPPPDINLNLDINSPGQIFVRGRGLDAELQGHLHIGGTAAAPQPQGKFTLRRGTFNLVGTTLTFTKGEVGFDGSGKIDPTLNFVASSESSNIVANLNITGYASAPKISLSSTPELPQDEVLARLLFNQSAGSLSVFQYASIAAALAQISGVGGGGPGLLDSLRSGLGLDRLSVGGGQNGSGPQVQAGRYIAPGIYVGAKQGTSGSTQAQVQIDLARGLKLQAGVGPAEAAATSQAGSTASQDQSGTNVGITYQFEY